MRLTLQHQRVSTYYGDYHQSQSWISSSGSMIPSSPSTMLNTSLLLRGSSNARFVPSIAKLLLLAETLTQRQATNIQRLYHSLPVQGPLCNSSSAQQWCTCIVAKFHQLVCNKSHNYYSINITDHCIHAPPKRGISVLRYKVALLNLVTWSQRPDERQVATKHVSVQFKGE